MLQACPLHTSVLAMNTAFVCTCSYAGICICSKLAVLCTTQCSHALHLLCVGIGYQVHDIFCCFKPVETHVPLTGTQPPSCCGYAVSVICVNGLQVSEREVPSLHAYMLMYIKLDEQHGYDADRASAGEHASSYYSTRFDQTKAMQRSYDMGWSGSDQERLDQDKNQGRQCGRAAPPVVSSAQSATTSRAAAASAAATLPRLRTVSLQQSGGSAAASLLNNSSEGPGSATSTQSCDAFLK